MRHDFGCCCGAYLQGLNKWGKTLKYELYGPKFEPRVTQTPSRSAVHSADVFIIMLLLINILALSSGFLQPVGLCVYYNTFWHLPELNIFTTKMEVRHFSEPSKQTPCTTRFRGQEEYLSSYLENWISSYLFVAFLLYWSVSILLDLLVSWTLKFKFVISTKIFISL